MIYLTVSLISFAAGCVVVALCFRRHYSNQGKELAACSKELLYRTEALQTIMYRMHHLHVNPTTKRIRGLSNLGSMAAKKNLDRFENLLTPSHPIYSKLVTEEKLQLKYFTLIEREASKLEVDNMDNIKEFEHLQ